MSILNFGSCNIDYVYSLDHIVKEGETEATFGLEIFSGGKGLNQSIALSRAGATVFHAGCIGEDGDFLLEMLQNSGVDVSKMIRVPSKNGHAVIQVSKDAENSIFLYPGSNVMMTEKYVENVLEGFTENDTVLLQNETNLVPFIIEKAHERGMKTVFNPSPINDVIKQVDLNKLTYVILNKVEAQAITGKDNKADILEFFKANYPSLKVMLTLGVEGSVYMENGSTVFQEAFKTKAVDTTAAGDTFTGYFVKGITENEDIRKTLKMAAMASSIAVSRKGAAPSIPDKEEVISRM